MSEEVLTDQQLDAIMEKIQHMIALRDNPGASVGEVENATVMIQRLLTKYNLSMHEIEQRDPERKASNPYIKGSPFDLGASSLYRVEWRVSLCNVIARNNFCRMRFYSRTGSRKQGNVQNAKAILIGKPYNIEIVKEVYEWVADQLNRLASKAWIEYDKRGYYVTKKDTKPLFKSSFFKAAIAQIAKRLEEERLKAQQTSTALLVIDNSLTEYVESLYPTPEYHYFTLIVKPTVADREMLAAARVFKMMKLCLHVMKDGKFCGAQERASIHYDKRKDEKLSYEGAIAGEKAGREINLTPRKKIEDGRKGGAQLDG